jgi:hypothetical protein
MLMRRLISAGVSAGDAAEQARAHDGAVDVTTIVQDYLVREDLVQAMHNAAKILDKKFIETVLRKELASHGVEKAWSEIIVPLLFLVGNDWEVTGEGVEIEHLLSEVLKSILREHSGEIKNPVNANPVLLASVGEETHSLALHALAASLAERKIDTYFLGARTPLAALCGVISRSAPPAVFLWAQLAKNADPKFFNEIPAIRPAPRVIVGGPGWDPQKCGEVVIAQDLTHACAEIERAVGL